LSPQNLTSDDYQEAVRFVQKQGYDTIFVGSDEIWKKGDGFIVRPFPNIYWLSGAITARKIAISASANKLVPRDLSPNEIDWVTERLRDFAFIGVRDRHTFDLVSALAPECGERLYRMYDPTFALEVGKPDKEWYRRRGVRFDRKIAGITFCDPRINDILVDALKMRGYQVVALSWYNARADVNLAGELSPLGWAETFHIFDLCLTNLFHGTVFSIKAGRPFISFDSFHGLGFETKMESLLKDMGLMRHYWPQESFLKYPALIEEKIDEVLSGSGSSPYAEAVKTGQASLQSFLDKVKDLV
jgi:hypothetical protein